MDRTTALLPKNPKQWTNVALAALFATLICLVTIASAQHLSDEQFIGNEELKRNVQQLESYSAEATLLHTYTLKNSTPHAYVQTYASSLKDATDSVTERLTEHAHAKQLDDSLQQTLTLGYSLSDTLDQLQTEPTSQLPKDMGQTLDDLSNALQNMESQL